MSVQEVKVKRIKELDFLRGIAMILVILGHCHCPVNDWLLAFHMPLFFFITGVVLSIKPIKRPFKLFLYSRFVRLIIPYFLFEAISLIISIILCFFHGDMINLWWAIKDILFVRHSVGVFAHTGIISRFWFFPCLFFASLIVYPLLRYSNKRFLPLWMGILFLCGFLVSRLLPFRLPFSVDIAIVAAGFVMLGYVLSNQTINLLIDIRLSDAALLLIGAVFLVIAVKLNPDTVSMFINSYGNYFFMLLGSVGGIIMTVVLTKYLMRLAGLSSKHYFQSLIIRIGFITLPLFPVHLFVIYFLDHLHVFNWGVLFPLTLVISIPIAYLIDKWFPSLAGKHAAITS